MAMSASTPDEAWTSSQRMSFAIVFHRITLLQEEARQAAVFRAFKQWFTTANKIRQQMLDYDQLTRLVLVLKSSIRCCRTTLEKEEIRRYFMEYMQCCVPSSVLSFSDMDKLCDEVDWVHTVGRSLLFLQGDFGNVYYMIAKGRVGLYLEPSKDREMAISRDFGSMRLQPFQGTDADFAGRLGNNILVLERGSGFGEYAVLAATNKIRSCTAVALDEDSVLLYLHADTYNAVLRQHHFRQTRLDSSIALLQELPLFQQLSPSVLTAIAYTIKSQTYSRNEVVVADGEVINNLFLIASGDIKVHAPAVATTAAATSSASVDSTDSRSVSIRKTRPPSVAVAVMSRGKLIGEAEVFQDARLFEFSYRVSSSIAELLAIPATVLREALHANRVKESQVYRSIEAAHLQKKMVIDERVKTALRMTTAMMMAKSTTEGQGSIRSKELKSKSELAVALPVMKTAPVPFSNADRNTNGSGSYGSNARKSFSWSSEDSEVAVTRRIPSDGAATSYRIAPQTSRGTAAAAPPSSTSSSSSSTGTSSRIAAQAAVPPAVKEHHQASSYRVAAATATGPARTSSSSGQQQQGGGGFLSAVSSLKLQAGLSDLSSRLTTASYALFNPSSSSSSKPLAPPSSTQPSKVSKSPRKV